ncbi:MAG: DNA translocase FtsK [Solirubrobacteraceae bacterium]
MATRPQQAKRPPSTRARRTPPPTRAKRSPLASRRFALPRPRLELDPHHVDIAGLALIAVGVFLSGVAYLHWAGGALGAGAITGARFALGLIGYAVPPALVIAGVLILIRELRAVSRPMRTAVACLTFAMTLALAAGTLGIGPGGAPAHGFWHPATLETRGGVLGGAELWIASHLLSSLGAQILSVFLLVAGLILLTGATFASVARATGAGVRGTSRALRHCTEELAAALAQRPATAAAKADAAKARATADADPDRFDPGTPSFAADADRPLVAATHVEAPPVPAGEAGGRAGDAPDPGPDALERLADASEHERERAGRAGEAPANPPGDDPDEQPGTPGRSDAPARETDRAQRRPVVSEDLTPAGRYRASVTEDPDFLWRVPGGRFLTRSTGEAAKPDTAGQEQVARTLVEALGHFGVEAQVIGRVAGPHVTRYELRLAPGTKVSKVAGLKDDLAYALAATDIRILAPIPGKQAVGVEVPNARRRIVHLGDVFQEPPPDWSPLTVWLGKDIAGRAIGADLAKMPHLLVAGTTGAGKSACVNAMLSSVLLSATPHEVRLVLVDPKQVELNHYESIPHLLTPVITSPRMAANALQNLVKEMERRYGIMSLARTRSLPELNRALGKRNEPPLPYILCVIDELADLMMVAPADVEDSIIRLAQKARAVGIHLVLATQSPRVDVITGMIKANVPSRIAFAVSSQTDSRVILDHNGAESLLGQGDMLFSPVGTSKLQRIQGAYVDEEQIAELTDAWRRQGAPEFQEELLAEVPSEDDGGDEGAQHADEDPLLAEAIALVAQMGTASTSMLQRRLRLGYTRAGRLMDMLERRAIISGYEGSKPRQVLIAEADVPRILSHLAEPPAAEAPGAALAQVPGVPAEPIPVAPGEAPDASAEPIPAAPGEIPAVEDERRSAAEEGPRGG